MGRPDKVAEAIKKEVSLIIHDELKDPRLGFVTVTDVKVTQDLREAKIFFSVLGSEEERKKTKEALNSGLGFIRRLVGQRIQLRFVPAISFADDRSGEYGVRIEEILSQIKEQNKACASAQGVARKKTRKEGRHGPKRSLRSNKKK
ncbi:MAG: 30S ribosome-binding factor RbfA [Candidatus Omnitrophota bacterium]